MVKPIGPYLYSRQVKDASAKMSISTVPLYGRDVN